MREFITNQTRLAEHVKVTKTHLSRVKNGFCSPGLELIERLFHTTGITPHELYTNSPAQLGKKFKKFFDSEKLQEKALKDRRKKKFRNGRTKPTRKPVEV